eukprot:scaffold168327_cov35-Tisochrysis_lutea.AAC.1
MGSPRVANCTHLSIDLHEALDPPSVVAREDQQEVDKDGGKRYECRHAVHFREVLWCYARLSEHVATQGGATKGEGLVLVANITAQVRAASGEDLILLLGCGKGEGEGEAVQNRALLRAGGAPSSRIT